MIPTIPKISEITIWDCEKIPENPKIQKIRNEKTENPKNF